MEMFQPRKLKPVHRTTSVDGRHKTRGLLLILAVATMTAGCASTNVSRKPAAVPEIHPGILMGYLPGNALPNSLALLPAPPAEKSAAFALDEEMARGTVALRGTPRWTLAISDANLGFPHAADTFSCALNAPITEEQTPRLYMLLRRTFTDAALSTYAAKNNYSRARPFAVNNEPLCTPDERAVLEKDGSYPSGHTAIGWAWALILSEISPAQADAILARGLAFGESRIVCNVHWYSDVIQGRVMGAGTVAKLHSDPLFRADLEAASAELAAIRQKGLSPARDCAAEAAALTR